MTQAAESETKGKQTLIFFSVCFYFAAAAAKLRSISSAAEIKDFVLHLSTRFFDGLKQTLFFQCLLSFFVDKRPYYLYNTVGNRITRLTQLPVKWSVKLP